MGGDFKIDPVTRDFVADGAGGWETSDDSRGAVLCQLETRYQAWAGDPTAGSRIAEMMESGDPLEERALLDEVRRALQVLVDAGVISELVVNGDRDEAGRLAVLIYYRDSTTGSPVDVAYSPWGGAP